MMINFPGSSEQSIKPPIPSAVVDKLAALATDEPLPDTYPGDRIKLFAQSPRRLHVYWGLSNDPSLTLKRAFGHQAIDYSLVVRLVDIETGDAVLHRASSTKSQWIEARAGKTYRVDLGLYAAGRAFIRILSSNTVETPPSGVAAAADQSSAWHVSSEKFAQVLNEAGYVSDALEVTLEALDQITDDKATRSIAGTFDISNIPPMTEENLAEMRRLLAALAFGASIEGLRGDVSPLIADWLSRFPIHTNVMNSDRMLEILRSLLGIELSQIPDSHSEEAMRRVTRATFGASEINLPDRPFHLWMPSMNARRLELIARLAV